MWGLERLETLKSLLSNWEGWRRAEIPFDPTETKVLLPSPTLQDRMVDSLSSPSQLQEHTSIGGTVRFCCLFCCFVSEEEEEVEELDEQQIAVVEVMEDPRFTQLVEEDYQEVAETGTKLCFLCRSPRHLARNCGMRMRNLSSAMSQISLSARGSSRGWRGPGRRWRGGNSGRARGRAAPLGGFPTQLPPGGHTSMRPITSSQPGSPRNQDF